MVNSLQAEWVYFQLCLVHWGHYIRLILVILMSLALSSQANANKHRFSDKDGEIIEFSSFMGSDLWGTKGKQITAHGILASKCLRIKSSSFSNLDIGLGDSGRDNRMCEMLSK